MAGDSDERMRAALERLCGGPKNPLRRKEVASLLGVHEQTLYQVIAGVRESKTGKPKSIGKQLREKLDAKFPAWLDGSPAALPPRADAITRRILATLDGIDDDTRLDCLQAIQAIVEARKSIIRARASGE